MTGDGHRRILYTDGGAAPNPGPGGWGVVVLDQDERKLDEYSGGSAESTNNRMELTAAIEALARQPAAVPVVLYTDSTYVRNGITKWIHGWIRKNWRRGPKGDQPVLNDDLWKRLHALTTERQVEWRWLKGHAGHEHNERADELATEALRAHGGGVEGSAVAAEAVEADHEVFIKVRAVGRRASWLALLVADEGQQQLDGRVDGTANRAELAAGLEVLQRLPRDRSILIRSGDYLAKGCRDWLPGWKSRGWQTAAGDPVKNDDLWRLLDREIVGRRLMFGPLPKTGPLASELKRRMKDLS